jgi:hypothetical protein
MTEAEITNQLAGISSEADLAERSEELVDLWTSESAGLEVVEPILRFMEAHPVWDYGMPGPLVHFVERFYGKGYEQRLIDSIDRKPTFHTVWMLNRIINGQKTPETRKLFIDVMTKAERNRLADDATVRRIKQFVALHSRG